MLSDPMADMLTRIKNGYLAQKKRVVVPFSGSKEKLAQILVKEGFLKAVKKEEQELILQLKYQEGKPALREIKRVSKSGRRIYKKAKDLRSTKSGLGISIISSPRGLITDKVAQKKHLGGEVVCEVW